MDEDPILAHTDMGMSMGGMSMDAISAGGCSPEHAAMGHCEVPEHAN
ncbi:MAG: putative metal-dependent phosphotriesterase family hydrolase [Arenicella sp.]|jgi:predicted metal-dependent phosphotriesterase family hydrolase